MVVAANRPIWYPGNDEVVPPYLTGELPGEPGGEVGGRRGWRERVAQRGAQLRKPLQNHAPRRQGLPAAAAPPPALR